MSHIYTCWLISPPFTFSFPLPPPLLFPPIHYHPLAPPSSSPFYLFFFFHCLVFLFLLRLLLFPPVHLFPVAPRIPSLPPQCPTRSRPSDQRSGVADVLQQWKERSEGGEGIDGMRRRGRGRILSFKVREAKERKGGGRRESFTIWKQFISVVICRGNRNWWPQRLISPLS